MAQYEAAHQLLSLTLGEYAKGKVSELCEKEYDASESYEPIEVNPKTTGEAIALTGLSPECMKVQDQALNAQASFGSGKYTYSFSVLTCDEDMGYEVSLQGDSSKIIASGILQRDGKSTGADTVVDSNSYTQICISYSKSSGSNMICFPII